MHTHFANKQHSFESILLDASAQLNLYEKRLLLLVIDKVKTSKNSFDGCAISAETLITISAPKYVEIYGGDIESAFEELKLACHNMFSREIPYPIVSPSGRSHNIPSRWLNGMCYEYSEARIELVFPIFITSKLKSLEKSLISSINN